MAWGTETTTLLQVLEEACGKQGFSARDYGLKFQRTVLDLSVQWRFAKLPNNAKLEMVPVSCQRADTEDTVRIALQLDDGSRLQDTFHSSQTLWALLQHFTQSREFVEQPRDSSPVCIYMRDEIAGRDALEKTTLKLLGLTGGSAIIRVVMKKHSSSGQEEAVDAAAQANEPPRSPGGPSKPKKTKTSQGQPKEHEQLLEREPVVCHLDLQPALPPGPKDFPDEFFEVTVDDVRKRLSQLQSERKRLEETPLMTKSMREAQMKEKLERYPKVVLRVHFPDRYVLQGFFRPSETVGDLRGFVRSHLADAELPFYLFITPPRTILSDESLTLFEANLFPAALVHFGSEERKDCFLRPDLLESAVSPSAADLLVARCLPTASEKGPWESAKVVETARWEEMKDLGPLTGLKQQKVLCFFLRELLQSRACSLNYVGVCTICRCNKAEWP
ncbi:tether containing UBX domain for GLUT4 isoform B [Alligator mississippiensis]|uniref:Tether containing UBX domain for GLUT4 isoform B n=1 Tax=Alligator mississippiensis TaxID=8496 RepID=A0A151LZE8_ALLMI|nr:tether containing UBX domain for GLUT4 isoform B [Alligator mississippiensis]